MPGIHIVSNTERLSQEVLTKNLEVLLHYDNYYHETLGQGQNLWIGFTGYPGYPFETLKRGDLLVVMDGKIYGHSLRDLEEELTGIASKWKEAGRDLSLTVKAFAEKYDGDYLIFLADLKRGNGLFFNDPLGRLSVYLTQKRGIVISREIGFILRLLKNWLEPDPQGIASYLMFSFPLGERTLYRGIRKVRGGVILRLEEGNIFEENYWKWDLGEKQEIQSVRKAAEDLRDIFLDAIKKRIMSFPDDRVILSLSGGLDSRAIALAFKTLSVQYHPVTFLDHEGIYGKDVKIAKEVSKKLGNPTTLIELGPLKIEDIEKLIELKGGLNYIRMSSRIHFLREIKNRFGDRISFYTGDEGDIILPYIQMSSRVKSIEDLVHWLIVRHRVFKEGEVHRITGIDPADIAEEIGNMLAEYPEDSLYHKFLHFLIFERRFKWGFEGEDRNRFFFWSLAPFYSLEFFTYAMSLEEKIKKYHRLYREFLALLDGDLIDLPRAQWGFPITSKKVYMREFMKWVLFQLPTLTAFLDRNVDKKKVRMRDPALIDYLERCLEKSPAVKSIINVREAKKILFQETGMERERFSAILTVLLTFIKFSDIT